LTQAQIDGLNTFPDNPVYDELQKAVIRYAEDITENVAASDATFQAVRRKLDEQEMVELTMTIAWANFTNRCNETFQTELEHR
jgi:alkylhydroperoxidase family enzyme